MRKRLVGFGVALAVLAAPLTAQAGGYDTPMLYSARHMGMGGTAVYLELEGQGHVPMIRPAMPQVLDFLAGHRRAD